MGAKAVVRGAAALAIIGTPGPDVLHGTDGDDEINGRDGDDILYGEAGNDSLDGWAGADRMEGGAGDDIYFVDDAGDRVVEIADGGIDLVRTALDARLGAYVENLQLHAGALTGIGNVLGNLLSGNSNANRLDGRGGADTLVGGDGGDQLFGGTGDDIFHGGVREDLWIRYDTEPWPGDDGADVIYGETGTDTFVVPSWYGWDPGESWRVNHGVTVDLTAETVDYLDPAFSQDLLFSIENLQTGDGDDIITGSKKDNLIDCGGGYNSVKGMGGDDRIVGGATVLYYGEDEPAVMERLDGGGGDDVIRSGGSYWVYYGFHISQHGLTIDRLQGRGGDDRLVGGVGHTVMTGGAGEDVFEARADTYEITAYPAYTVDLAAATVTITDFDPGSGDRIELRVGTTSYDENFKPVRGNVPDFVGRTARVDIDEVGYSTLQRADGSTDTIITHHYLYSTPFSVEPFDEELDFRIVLEDYVGGLAEDWIEFV